MELLAKLFRLLWWPFEARIYKVYHQDSPGIAVWVIRRRYQTWIRNANFTSVGEKHYWSQRDAERFWRQMP